MATLKDIQRKISAVKKTQQITKAMNMVATSKLRGAQQAVEQFRPYAEKFRTVLGSLAAKVEPDIHPFFQTREEVENVALIVITGDRGLCGSFNVNIAARAKSFIDEKKAQGAETKVITAGRKGRDFFRKRGGEITAEHLDVLNRPDFELAREIGRTAIDMYLTGEVDEVHVAYTRFVNVAMLEPTITKLLPLSPEDLIGEEEADDSGQGEYLVEPSAGEVLIELLPKNINVQILSDLLETACSQFAAQMSAMENATNNCKEMIGNLTLIYNKARQAAITAELMDIVGGAEALKQ